MSIQEKRRKQAQAFSKVIQTLMRLGYIVLVEKNSADEMSITQLILLCDAQPMAEEDPLPPQDFT